MSHLLGFLSGSVEEMKCALKCVAVCTGNNERSQVSIVWHIAVMACMHAT